MVQHLRCFVHSGHISHGEYLKSDHHHLSALALVLAVLGEEAAEEVSTATCHMDQRTLLPQAETRRHRQNQGDRLDQQGPFPQVAPDDEATEDRLYLQYNRYWKMALNHFTCFWCCDAAYCRPHQCFSHLWDS